MGKEIRTSRQKSREALDQVRRFGPQPRQAEKREPVQKVVLEPEVIDPVSPCPALKSSFPDIIPQSSNIHLQTLEHTIATGEDLIPSEGLNELFKKDLEGVSFSMIRGIRRWKDYLRL